VNSAYQHICAYHDYANAKQIIVQLQEDSKEENVYKFSWLQAFDTMLGRSAFLGVLSLKIGPTGCLETSVKDYHSTLINTSKMRSSHLQN
jgi:hypothetical protein